jgi:hypothetical protein
MENENFMSLYDFLGKAAGTELGKEVADEAKEQGQKIITKEVKNKAYTGKVMMYNIDFLTKYFTKTQEPSVKTPDEDYELPF